MQFPHQRRRTNHGCGVFGDRVKVRDIGVNTPETKRHKNMRMVSGM
jgi:hypothetical protein